jgi:hypothetical protein
MPKFTKLANGWSRSQTLLSLPHHLRSPQKPQY